MAILMLRAHRNSISKPRAFIRPIVLFVFACIAITGIAFWTTLRLLNQWGAPASWPSTAVPPGTPSSTLADLPALPDERFSWLGIAGINARVVSGLPAVSGQPILRLIAVQDGVHTIAARASGLIKNERYRIIAWILPQGGANFGIAARDQPDKDNGPNNGRAIFDLASLKVSLASGNAKAGIEQVGEWVTVWIDLRTTDGQYVVNFYLCSGGAEFYTGDGRLGVILGGI